VSLRPATPVLSALAALLALAGVEGAHARLTAPREAALLADEAQLVRALGLTDLALFTEARYTRHPALADLATAFQDNPLSFEHFPSGSLIAPPENFGQTALGFTPEGLR